MFLARTLSGPVYVFERPVRMLVADDDPIMREFALAQLQHPGGEIVTAEDGEQAWDILSADTRGFDLVLSDLDMPKMNGFALVQTIRAEPRFANLPIVVITSRDDMFAIDRAYEVGATSFVTKPVNWRLLGYQLRYVLRASRMEADLRTARDEAEQAAALRNSLLTLLQHETRTPLHAIIGYCELLQTAHDAGATARDYVGHVVGAARTLNETLKRVFFFSQLHAGAVPLDQERVILAHVVDDAVRSLQSVSRSAEVALTREDALGAARAVCDVRLLSEALREVLSNALTYSPRGASVVVATRHDEAGLVVEVRDRGPGLDEPTLKRCREPFAQSDDPLTRSFEGLGLGLPAAQRILDLHGGRLEIASAAGEGTVVRLRLPEAAPPLAVLPLAVLDGAA